MLFAIAVHNQTFFYDNKEWGGVLTYFRSTYICIFIWMGANWLPLITPRSLPWASSNRTQRMTSLSRSHSLFLSSLSFTLSSLIISSIMGLISRVQICQKSHNLSSITNHFSSFTPCQLIIIFILFGPIFLHVSRFYWLYAYKAILYRLADFHVPIFFHGPFCHDIYGLKFA